MIAPWFACRNAGVSARAPLTPRKFRQKFYPAALTRNPWQFTSDRGWLISANAFLPWSLEKFRDRVALLLEQGCIKEIKTNTYQLSHWEEYRLR